MYIFNLEWVNACRNNWLIGFGSEFGLSLSHADAICALKLLFQKNTAKMNSFVKYT